MSILRLGALIAVSIVANRHSVVLAQSFSASSDSSQGDEPIDDSPSLGGSSFLPEDDTAPQPSTDKPDNSLRWTQCTDQSAGFQCATLTLPVCHDKSCGSSDTFDMKITRYETIATDDSPVVWMLPTDTKDLGAEMKRTAQEAKAIMFAMENRLDLLAAKYKYASGVDACEALSSTFGMRRSIDSSYLTAVEDCSKWMASEIGKDGAAAFSLDNAAKDVHVAMTSVQEQVIKTSTTKTYLYSAASNTQVVQRLIALDIKDTAYKIAGYIYENPYLMKLPADYDKLGGDAMDKFIDSCDSDDVCKSKYSTLGTTVAKVLEETYAAMDASADPLSACAKTFMDAAYDSTRDATPSDGMCRLLAWMASYDKTSARIIPPVLYRLKRCSKDDDSDLKTVVSRIKSRRSNEWIRNTFKLRDVVERIVLVSELWPNPTPSQNELDKTFSSSLIAGGLLPGMLPTYCAFTGSSSSACSSVYSRGVVANPRITLSYPPPKKLSSKVDAKTGVIGADADVLILTSRLQLNGSVQAAEQLYNAHVSASTSGRTAILVASDTIPAGSQLDSGVFDRFIKGKAAYLSGQWFTSDLASSLDSKPSRSTYSTAPVLVDFTTERDESWEWFGYFGSAWEADDEFDIDFESFGLSVLWWIVIIIGALLVGALILTFVIIRHQRESSRRRMEQERQERERRREQEDFALAQELAYTYAPYQQAGQGHPTAYPSAPAAHQSV